MDQQAEESTVEPAMGRSKPKGSLSHGRDIVMEIYDDEEDPDFLPDINYGVYEDEEDLVPMEDLNNFRVNPEPEQLQFVMSKKGRDMVEYDGYLYTFRYNEAMETSFTLANITEEDAWPSRPCGCRQTSSVSRALRISMANRKVEKANVSATSQFKPHPTNELEQWHSLLNAFLKKETIVHIWVVLTMFKMELGVASKAKAIRVRDPLLQNKRSKTSNPAIILALVDATENFNSENVPASLTSVTRATRAIQVDRRSGEADRRIPRYP
uniref:Uncharacterized protein n=1 Tax=Ditylenchus dipsaci TaxID=166011 RepID=A0A915ELB4_9BILA